MAIVSCEHNSGMGLCPECTKKQEYSYSVSMIKSNSYLDSNKSTLKKAAEILRTAGKFALAAEIENMIIDAT